MTHMKRNDLIRFFTKIKFTDIHWEWIGAKNNDGYGYWWDGKRLKPAHVISYKLFLGKIPKGLQIDHICQTRNCVKPTHLWLVTPKENSHRGEKHNANKKKCPKGHPYKGDNLITTPEGWRKCKTCRNERQKAYWQQANLKAA